MIASETPKRRTLGWLLASLLLGTMVALPVGVAHAADGDAPAAKKKAGQEHKAAHEAMKEHVRELQEEKKEAKKAGDKKRVREITAELYKLRQERKKAQEQKAKGAQSGGRQSGGRQAGGRQGGGRPNLDKLPPEVRKQVMALHRQMRAAREAGNNQKAQQLRKQLHKIFKDNGMQPPRRRGGQGGGQGGGGKNR